MVAKNFQGFSLDLEKFAKMVDQDVATVRRRATLGILERVLRRSPVDKGRFRSGWFSTDGQPSAAVPPEIDGRITRDEATQRSKGQVTARFSQPYDTAWIVNNLPYGQRLEYGWSQQAPQGMVRIALAEEEAALAATTEKLR